MEYKIVKLRCDTPESVSTEIMFNIASERAVGTRVVCLDFPMPDDEPQAKRLRSGIIRLLKSMKAKKSIQFFVSAEGLRESTTEARFLINKYPDAVRDTQQELGREYIFVKL